MKKLMNMGRKSKIIVSMILIIASVCATGAFSVRVKADTSKKYDIEGMERDTVINIDNDGNMEVLVDIPTYEGTIVSVLKYKDGKLEGETNINASVAP